MPRGFDNAVSMLGASFSRIVCVARALRAERCVGAAMLLSVAVSVSLAGVVICCKSYLTTATVQTTEAASEWRYLTICENCGQRTRHADNPAQKWPSEGRLLKCPECEAFKVTWYRRGSQSVPPGGW